MLRAPAPTVAETVDGRWALRGSESRPIQAVVLGAAAVSLTYGCTLMAAWLTRATAILQWPVHNHPIVFNAALGFAVSGIALAALYRGSRWVVVGAGAVDALVGLLVLAEHALDRGLGIDQLFAHAYLTQPGAIAGRMAVNTAACFVLVGAGLLTFGLARGPRLGAVLAAVASGAAAIASLSLFGWASDVPTATAWGRATAMAVPTAMTLIAVAAGLIAFAWASPHRRHEWLAMPAGAAAIGVAAMIWLALTNRTQQHGTLSGATATGAVAVMTAVMAALVALVVWMALRSERGRQAAEAESSRRAEAELALRASETRLFQVLEAMPTGIVVSSSGGRTYYANAEAARLLGEGVRPESGRSGESGEGSQPLNPIYAEGSERFYPAGDVAMLTAMRGESADLDGVEVHHPDSGAITVEVRGRPIVASDGRVEYALVVFDDVSRRRAVERSLAEQAEVLDLAYDAIFIKDDDQVIRSWNHGAELTYGFTKAEAIGRRADTLLRTEFPVPLDQIETELEAVGTWQGELVQYRRGGGRIVVASRWAVRRAPDGSQRGSLEINRDISLSKEAASYARRLIEASLDPLVTISPEGTITDVNESTVRATGVPREELVGTDFSEYFTEPDKAREGYQRVFAEGMVTDYPLTLRHRSGALMDVLYNASVYRDRAGSVLGVFAAARDVTAQRQAASYARSLIEASLDPLVTISPEGTITDVNESTIQATGVPREELVGTDFSEYFTEPDKAREGYQRVFAEGMVTDYPLTLRHRSGALMEVLYNASVYRDRAGNVLGVFAAARDVTARKRAEDELARRASELEIANRDLGRSNSDLEQFAYIASHDLAEPLRAISGPISLVARRYRGQIDEEADEFIGFAVDGCQRMQSLIDGLLTFSRVGRIEGVVEAVDADEVARDAVAALGPTLRNCGAEVSVGPLGQVLVERDQLSQVLQNLIGNAVKFVAPGVAPRVTVTAEDVDGMRRIDVVDNGIGIEQKYRAQIFTMFKRLHARDEYPGTGIGLALVKKIVERHGGAVGVEGGPTGTGCRFWFTLPTTGEDSR